MTILLHLIAILPGLLVAYFIYRLDKFEKEPPAALVSCFFLGMLATVPSMYLEYLGENLGWEGSGNVFLVFLFAVIVVGFSEEVTKYLFLLGFPYTRRFFNEPMDGIIYAVMIGMGFATLENILYADRYGLDVTLVRAFTAVPAHAIFAVISGYYMGLAKFSTQNKWKYLTLALALPVLIHGLYDFFIIQNYYEWMMGISTFILVVCGYWSWILIEKHRENSPFREDDLEIIVDNDLSDAVIDDMEKE